MRGRRAALAAALAAIVVVWGAVAFACTNLATMTLSAPAGHPGDTITLVGTSFPVPRAGSSATTTPVVLRWRSSEGPVLATAVPDRTGSISATFQIPPSEPGHAVIIGVQKRQTFNPDDPDAPAFVQDEPGTPARASFRVLAAGEMAPPARAPGGVAVADGEGTTSLIVLIVLFGAVALSLFAGGVMAFLYQMRSRRPVAQPCPPPEWWESTLS
ncbi:MAG: hypothetical protein ACLGI2_17625 [Acidimicrobiia bacterium]